MGFGAGLIIFPTHNPFDIVQSEVSCNPDLEDSSNVWNIENHSNELLEPVSPAGYALSFWDAFWEVNETFRIVRRPS